MSRKEVDLMNKKYFVFVESDDCGDILAAFVKAKDKEAAAEKLYERLGSGFVCKGEQQQLQFTVEALTNDITIVKIK